MPRIVVLTDQALYLFEQHFPHMVAGTELAGKPIPRVLLRRRVSLLDGHGLDSLTISKFADPCVGLTISAGRSGQTQGDKSYWTPDDQAPVCSVSGQPFSLFHRRQ